MIASDACKQVNDIGVQVKTDFLMAVFPARHQHLFEPSPAYHAQLEANYREAGIAYSQHKIALSETDGVLYLHETSVDGSGRVTHTQIRPERDEAMRFLVGIKEISTRRLDSVFAPGCAPRPLLSGQARRRRRRGADHRRRPTGAAQRLLRHHLDLYRPAAELEFRPWEYSEGKVHWPKWQHGFKHLGDTPVDDPLACRLRRHYGPHL